jgi:hypothetical protein
MNDHQGLYGKYILQKADGSGLSPHAKYFVLRYDADAEHGHSARIALVHYINAIKQDFPELAEDLTNAVSDETAQAYADLIEATP